MTDWPVHARFDGPIVMIGFGSIGRGTLPLLERHIGFDKANLTVIAPDDADRHLLDQRGIRFEHLGLTPGNFRDVLTPLLTGQGRQGLVVNLSVDTSSVALIDFAKDIGALYIDTVVEPWPGFYTDTRLSVSQRPPPAGGGWRGAPAPPPPPPPRPPCPPAAPTPAWCRGSSSRPCSTWRRPWTIRRPSRRRARAGAGSRWGSA